MLLVLGKIEYLVNIKSMVVYLRLLSRDEADEQYRMLTHRSMRFSSKIVGHWIAALLPTYFFDFSRSSALILSRRFCFSFSFSSRLRRLPLYPSYHPQKWCMQLSQKDWQSPDSASTSVPRSTFSPSPRSIGLLRFRSPLHDPESQPVTLARGTIVHATWGMTRGKCLGKKEGGEKDMVVGGEWNGGFTCIFANQVDEFGGLEHRDVDDGEADDVCFAISAA